MKVKGFILVLCAFLFFQSCGKKSAADFNSDFSLYKKYITSFTGGIVSAHSDIRLVLGFASNWKVNQVLDDDLFDISPSVDGKVIALSDNTIAFVPEEKLDSGVEYQITFNLEKINSQVAQKDNQLAKFNFTIKTIAQDFIINTLDIQSKSKELQVLNCVLKTADLMEFETAKELIEAEHEDDDLKIIFEKSSPTAKEFRFKIDGIKRLDEKSILEINYDGDDFDIDQEGTIEFPITAINQFEVVNTEIQADSQSLSINFSEPLVKGQDFQGLVAIQNRNNLKFSVQGNVLKVYFNNSAAKAKPTIVAVAPEAIIATEEAATVSVDTTGVAVDTAAVAMPVVEEVVEAEPEPEVVSNQNSGPLLLEIFQGIESVYGKKLEKNYSKNVSFDPIKPNVRFIKNGTILPSSSNLKLNFEAVNLRAVDVKVYKIYTNNILQFLQDNTLNGTQNLKRVAQPIAKTTLTLNQNGLFDTTKWNTYALDLAKIITPDPGAIYRVEFVFKKSYSLYPCNANNEEQAQEAEEQNEEDVNYSDNAYDDYYYDDYDWRESQDPCYSSYFYNAKIGTNILATDIGVIAKRGENKSYLFAVSNILTTDPIRNAKIDLYNFQQQKLASGTTSDEGIATFKLNGFAYFAIVSDGKQSTYVKLDDGYSLSVSNFNVSGQSLQKGLKGFIYGERGVWRPGDNLYLSFILNDAANKIPENHPIKMRLTDPNGKVSYETIQASNAMNHYAFTIPTDTEAPTGNWEAMVSVGGAKFYKSIKLETIKPNRLKIKNTFDHKVLSSLYPNISRLEATWLHGAVAKNLNVEMQAKFMQQNTSFKNYENYVFDDLVRKFNTEEINIFSGKLDENGKVNIPLKPNLQGEAPGMLKAAFITKVYEEGGDFSTDVVATTYSPYRTYVGVKAPALNKYNMLETRAVNQFDVVTVDENGRPKAVKNLEVKVFKVEWRWWWDSSSDNLSNYNASDATTSYKTFVINTGANGKGSVRFSLSDSEWGRYLIRVADPTGGHATALTVNVDWPIWSGKTRNTDASTANMLIFSTDKPKYAVGEKAQISFPSSEGGRALISIENGSNVVQTLWAETQKGETKVSIPITPQMAPNVYFNITLLQPHASTKNDSPIRMYGIVPIEVVDKNTILAPQLQMPAVLKPEQSFALKVSEQTGKAMTYTVAIVDEGLLDLTHFSAPNAWDAFYVREALGVKTWDIYDDVIGAYGGRVNQIFSIGGDQDLGGGKLKKANRFKPVVVFMGPFKLEKGETKIHQIKLPKYIGAVKTMIVAADANTSAYGSVEKATPVRSPLMVLASLPRKISPSERVTVPVTVFATENNIKNVSVEIKTSNGIQVIGSKTQRLTFTQPDEKMAYFNLAVGPTTGIGKIQLIARSGSQQSIYEVEIDKTNPNPVTNTYTDVILPPNSTKTISWKTFGVSGSNKAKLEISSMPTINLNGRLQYLIQYPHGCVEQTTSSVFPQLYLGDITDIDANNQALIQKNVMKGVNRLGSFQLANGGLAYWQGGTEADDWGTSYAGHFMIEAEKKGYFLPINFKSKWLAYQQKEAKRWRFESRYSNDLAQAYRLYTLALAGSPDLSSMNRLRETKGISNESKLRLAVGYALAGQRAAGLSLVMKTPLDTNNDSYYYYGSSDRNRAMALETMVILGQKQKAFALAKTLAQNLSSGTWMSTQTTAYGLYAMAKFSIENGPKGIAVQWTKDRKSETIATQKAIASRDLSIQAGTNAVVLKNNQKNTLFVRIVNTGILPIGQEKPIQLGASASIVFKNRKGAVLNISKIKQGTEFIAEVTVRSQKNEQMNNIALSQIIPSGFEIVNTRFTDFGDSTQNTADYIDIRDDRTNFYFGMRASETKTFRILLNASYLGKYYLPGLQCEAMYDPTFLARTKGFWLEVVK